jgi:hypothetical protein
MKSLESFCKSLIIGLGERFFFSKYDQQHDGQRLSLECAKAKDSEKTRNERRATSW